MRAHWRGAVAGLATGLAGVVAAAAVASLLNQRTGPVASVAELVRDLTPGPLAEKLIHLVGQADKPALRIGVLVAAFLLSAWAGMLAQRRYTRGALVFGVLAALGAIGAARSTGDTASALLPVLVGATVWLILLKLLTDPLREGATTPNAVVDLDTPAARTSQPALDRRPDLDHRRTFLIRTGAAVLGAAFVGVAGRYWGKRRREVEQARDLLELPVSAGREPTGADLRIDGLSRWRTPNSEFYRIDTTFAVPTIDPDDWKLRIHGMVDQELTLSYQDLLNSAITEDWITLCCVSNEVGGDLIGNAWWSGVRVAEVLARAGVHPHADAVLQTSVDGWTCGTPVAALTDDRNALLAIAMNGKPLPLEHGFPVRMVVPGLYGYVSATKWLVDLEVTRFDRFNAYWTDRGWAARGPVKTQSRIEVPNSGRAMAGSVTVAGSAWAQHTGIERVEVRLDGHAWTDADLAPVPGVDTWVQWRTVIEVSPGNHTLTVRATDKSGYTQTPVKQDVVPDGATGWHTVSFTAEG
ncbi:MAG: molybdopterin-dependent oxidoreductase [Nocardioidaceae bacterium]